MKHNFNLKDYFSDASENDEALIEAATTGDANLIAELIYKGVNPEIRKTAVPIAIYYEHDNAALVLMGEHPQIPSPPIN